MLLLVVISERRWKSSLSLSSSTFASSLEAIFSFSRYFYTYTKLSLGWHALFPYHCITSTPTFDRMLSGAIHQMGKHSLCFFSNLRPSAQLAVFSLCFFFISFRRSVYVCVYRIHPTHYIDDRIFPVLCILMMYLFSIKYLNEKIDKTTQTYESHWDENMPIQVLCSIDADD